MSESESQARFFRRREFFPPEFDSGKDSEPVQDAIRDSMSLLKLNWRKCTFLSSLLDRVEGSVPQQEHDLMSVPSVELVRSERLKVMPIKFDVKRTVQITVNESEVRKPVGHRNKQAVH